MNTITAAFDRFLNRFTMYRFLIYGLGILSAIGIGYSAVGLLALSVSGLVISLLVLLATCYLTNKILAKVWRVGSNVESTIITALILFCIMPPVTSVPRLASVFLAGFIAISSKYILAFRGKHILNPAAAGVAIISLIGLLSASWWIGSKELLPFTLIIGFLIVRKMRKFEFVFAAITASIIVMVIQALLGNQLLGPTISDAFTSWPLIFFVTIMLTEPATIPSRRNYQLIFAVLVGSIFASKFHVAGLFTTPQNALIIGNIFAFIVSPRYKLNMKFIEKIQLTPTTHEFIFKPTKKFRYLAGQYMEWTLPHARMDSRGGRRAFTLSSSPTENNIAIGVKFYEPSSSYKEALLNLVPGDTVTASQLGGDFVLPRSNDLPLVFIAGGIGVTPFKSMIRYILDTHSNRTVTLFYFVKNTKEIAYRKTLREAAEHDIKIIPILPSQNDENWKGYTGRLTPAIIDKEISDPKNCIFYISGPDAMVKTYKDLLRRGGIPGRQIRTDYFSGY